MTELVIDGKAVAMPENVSLKLSVVNPYFTDSDSFTYDIEIPVNDMRNARIFGQLNRLDSAKGSVELPARLTVDNRVLLDGRAVVTSVTQSTVKVQLLGQRTAYNYDATANGTYVDELWLGTITVGGGWKKKKQPDNYTSGDRGQHAGSGTSASAVAEGVTYEDPDGRWVKYPVMNTSTEKVSNDYLFYQDPTGTVKFGIVNVFDAEKHLSDMRTLYQTVQPKLWWICQLIAEATGYTLDKSDNGLYSDTFFRKIFIANTVPCCTLSSILPHWTVGEFWKYLREAFAMVTAVEGGQMRIIPRSTFYSQQSAVIPLEEVQDEYSCDVDDDEAADVSSSNTAFSSFDHDVCDVLDDAVTKVARYDYSFADLQDIRTWWKGLGSFRRDNYLDTIFKCQDGREYIYFKERFGKPVFAQVNQFAPRVTKKDADTGIELKFVPCAFHEHDIDIAVYVDQNGGGHYEPAAEQINTVTVEILGRPDRDRPVRSSYVLEEIIAGDETSDDSKPELVYLGLTGTTMPVTIPAQGGSVLSIGYPYPNLRERWIYDINADTVYCEHQGDSLALIPHGGSTGIGSSTVADGMVIDTKVKVCVKFHAADVPDTTRLFNIRNRLYACERIEVTVDSKGKQPMMTGYFFPASL